MLCKHIRIAAWTVSFFLATVTAIPIDLDDGGSDVCRSGIYEELLPLKNYPIAVAFCQVIYPPQCPAFDALARKDLIRYLPILKPKTTATLGVSSTTPFGPDATPSISSTVTESVSITTTTTTEASTPEDINYPSLWANCQGQGNQVVSTLCSCIQSYGPCSSSAQIAPFTDLADTTIVMESVPSVTTITSDTTSSETTTVPDATTIPETTTDVATITGSGSTTILETTTVLDTTFSSETATIPDTMTGLETTTISNTTPTMETTTAPDTTFTPETTTIPDTTPDMGTTISSVTFSPPPTTASATESSTITLPDITPSITSSTATLPTDSTSTALTATPATCAQPGQNCGPVADDGILISDNCCIPNSCATAIGPDIVPTCSPSPATGPEANPDLPTESPLPEEPLPELPSVETPANEVPSRFRQWRFF